MKKSNAQFNTNLDLTAELVALKKQSALYWAKRGDELPLKLFYFVQETVPAYRKFLEEHAINPNFIKTLDDFKKLPPITKDNYLRKYPYKELFSYKELHKVITYSATSGSTGEPFYFPRLEVHDQKYELAARLFFEDQFETAKKKTLVIVGFGLGIWIGGIITYRILYEMATAGHKISIAPIGTNKEQFILAFKKLAPLYDQVVLAGYPPFIKDVLDEGKDYGIRWKDYEIKIFTAAEGYSEKFREYFARKAGLKNYLSDTVNLYGTVEFGVMGHETALSNLIRHLASKNKKLFKTVFSQAGNLPTLCQYYPQLVFFEEVEIEGKHEVIGTGYGCAIPLVRYRFNDLGGVIPYETMLEKLIAGGIDLKQEMKNYHLNPALIYPLPFVYVYARSDFSVSLYGIVIYPEYLRDVVHREFVEDNITGRFTMKVNYDRKQNQFLELNIELRKGVRDSQKLNKVIEQSALSLLLEHSSEYNHLYHSSPTYQQRLVPKIKLWPHGHSSYFARTGKQPWVEK